jgi:hypothetical protein
MEQSMRHIVLILFIVLFFPKLGMTEEKNRENVVTLITDFTYKAGKTDSRKISKALALFGAKSKAVATSAKYLTHKGLLKHYGKKQSEIYCLAANEIDAVSVAEKFYERNNAYYIKIRATVRITDFIQAEIRDLELEKKELQFSYREEMEQYVSQSVDPGKELSRAYRYIRQGQWRISIIYLDHLEKKYPYWGDIYLARAFAFNGIHNRDKMIEALKTACQLENQDVCEDLKSFVRATNRR